jgi:flagellar biosynthesis protein FlhB
MAEESFQEKTEKATPRRREEVRRKGEVAKTRELPSAAVLLSGALALFAMGSFTYGEVVGITRKILSFSAVRGEGLEHMLLLLEECVRTFLLALSPLFALVFVTALAANLAQVGFLFAPKAVKPKMSKVNPLKGFARLFSKQSLMELVKSLLKLLIIGIVAAVSIRKELGGLAALGDMR